MTTINLLLVIMDTGLLLEAHCTRVGIDTADQGATAGSQPSRETHHGTTTFALCTIAYTDDDHDSGRKKPF